MRRTASSSTAEPLQSFGSFAEEAPENIVVIDTVSKRFSACGARIGCLITKNKELLGHALKYCQSRLSVATLDQVASAHLYTVGPEYFAAVRDEYKKRRDTLCRKLREIPGVVFDVPGGAFYLMAALPVMIAIAVIVVNATLFLSDCLLRSF